ncbi:MAG TPA: hypothetical protein DCS42_11965 [Nitrospiraceae bacterium]|nr:hypothetical protein [Nitrospiraceae bacterium]
MKKYFLSSLLLVPLVFITENLYAFTTWAGQFSFTESNQKTAEDIDLDFTPEKAEWKNGRVRVWGNIKNKTYESYQFVKITFSAWGTGHGNLLGRVSMYTDPMDIGPGQIGYIENFGINCGNQKPNDIEFKVTGRLK